jgi:hypothetical protein
VQVIKSLYWLKQAPNHWPEKFHKTSNSISFSVSEFGKCVYYHHGGGEDVILCLYADDILIFATNMKVINEDKYFLSKSFHMKDQ